MKNLAKYSLLFLIVLVTGCSSVDEKDNEHLSAQELYNQARTALNNGEYETAINTYETLEARYPFGRYAEQAQLEVAYAYYKYNEPDAANAAADRFIRTYPRHPNVDYAYYLRGLTSFLRGISFFDRYLPLDLSKRDPGSMQIAFDNFKELIEKFPDSRYAGDARQRMIYLRNQLAKHELNVADFYYRRKAYIASVNRTQYIIHHFQGTPAVADALALMAKGYGALNMPELQADTLKVLTSNFPDYQVKK